MTEQKCNEVLATTADYDANDGSLTDLIVNCKINQEIIPRLLGQRLLNRWTSQLDLGCTTG